MSRAPTRAIVLWRNPNERERRRCRTTAAPASKFFASIARWGFALGSWMALTGPVSAEGIDPIIALPDAPFVIPIPQTNLVEVNVTTQLYNNARLGANLTETTLNPDNVQPGRFGKLRQQQIKGQVLAQPLYVSNVAISGIGSKNLLIVATAANIVYALDANDLSIVFQKQLGPADTATGADNQNSIVSLCAETYPPYIGVTSTPVIDLATGTVFVESFNPTKGAPRQELHALSLHDQFASDRMVVISDPTVLNPQTKQIADWAEHHRNRAGLLLSNGVVYVAFASFICDNPAPYAGWVMGYRASDLTPVAYWETPGVAASDAAGSSGIWQSGRGLVAASDGTMYFMTGNDGHFSDLTDHTNDADSFRDPRLANSFVKLSAIGPNGLTLVDSFAPKNTSQLSVGDTDLGSSGPILLPGNRLVGGGKQGRVYVIDTTTMRSLQDHTQPGGDGFQGFQAFYNQLHPRNKLSAANHSCTERYDSGNPDAYCRQLHNFDVLTKQCDYQMTPLNTASPAQDDSICYLPVSCYQSCQAYGPNIHAGFVYWQLSATEGRLYAMPEKEHVEAFAYDLLRGIVGETPVATSNGLIVPDGMPGGALSISANGNQNGIVWASLPNQGDATNGIHRGSLVALDANDLHKLWSDDCIFWFAKFNPPTVANGRVYLATFAQPITDPSSATAPGPLAPDGTCARDDPALMPSSDSKNPDPHLQLPAGSAWVIQYGLK